MTEGKIQGKIYGGKYKLSSCRIEGSDSDIVQAEKDKSYVDKLDEIKGNVLRRADKVNDNSLKEDKCLKIL